MVSVKLQTHPQTAALTKSIQFARLSRVISHLLSNRRGYSFIVVRRPLPEDPVKLFTLFSMDKYSDQVIVTNMKLTLLNTRMFYNGQADVELILKELKGDYPLAKIPSERFATNRTYLHAFLFPYNIVKKRSNTK